MDRNTVSRFHASATPGSRRRECRSRVNAALSGRTHRTVHACRASALVLRAGLGVVASPTVGGRTRIVLDGNRP